MLLFAVCRHHSGKTYTIFSASNYTGNRGNRGSVMVFDDAMDFEIDEYQAPSLSDQAGLYNSRAAAQPSGGGELTRQESKSQRSRHQSDGMDAVILQRLREWITEGHDDLRFHFERKDPRNTGLISAAVRGLLKGPCSVQCSVLNVTTVMRQAWREGLTTVLRLNSIPLVQYRETQLLLLCHLACAESTSTGMVNSDFWLTFRAEAGDPRARWPHRLPSLPSAIHARTRRR